MSPSKIQRVVFVPVSGSVGTGEYARCVSIAWALTREWPDLEPHFLLSRHAPYRPGCPFPVCELPASATLSTPEVLACLSRLEPALVVFDNAGRTRQLSAVRAAGASAVYISSRPRQRAKAFRWRWMSLLDEHWIASPEALVEPLGTLEELKLRWLGRPRLRYLDAVLAARDDAAADALLGEDASARIDVLVVPGGGSSLSDAPTTPRDFVEAARELAGSGLRTVFVAGGAFQEAIEPVTGLSVLRGVSGGALHALLARARLVLVNGADSMLQALALGKVCVARPMSRDQAERLQKCRELGVVALPGRAAMARECERLLRSDADYAWLAARVAGLGWRDAMPEIVGALARLLQRPVTRP